jgi:hypothetical protein
LQGKDERNMPPSGAPPVVRVEQIAHRYSSYDTPFWARENTQPGRWHARGDGPTQYLSLTTDGSWAELIRNEELRTEDEVAMVSVQMWAIAVNEALVVDYSTFDRAADAGFDPEALVDEDHSRCRHEGARLRELSYGGVLAPSAALASSLPATVITKGAPPPGLLPRVRQIGMPHEGLIAFRAARNG